MRVYKTEVEVVRGAVQAQDVDAIVNAANTTMRGGGGVDGAIHTAAGSGLLEELRRVAPRGAETAQVIVTGGHGLPQPWIFHVAGPIYRHHAPGEAARLLRACYRRCLDEAHKRGCASLAFPSISTGAYEFPLEEAAQLAIGEIVAFAREPEPSSLRRIVLAMFGAREFEVFAQALENHEEAE
jgi:O-acetyl-ADP-ribose deacetylase (regulator of RNase III)